MATFIHLHLVLVLQIFISSYANIEGDALYALRKAVEDPTNVLQSWDPTLVDPCTWFHVTCDSDNRVTRLDLGNAKLSGNIVPELGKLERLEYLELYMNSFVGTIPYELGGLKNLISLDLFHNNLTGFIPPSLSKLSHIKFMRLNGNKLTGRIPRGLTKLPNLKIFDVSNNDLCGTFPTWGSFSKLTEERICGPGNNHVKAVFDSVSRIIQDLKDRNLWVRLGTMIVMGTDHVWIENHNS